MINPQDKVVWRVLLQDGDFNDIILVDWLICGLIEWNAKE